MNLSIILMLPVALALVGLARFAMWLFPEQVGNSNHYDGYSGSTQDDIKPLDDLTNKEHNAVGAWWGHCQGDE